MSMPLVSIMMPAYNVGEYIDMAIQSCLDQTYKDWELCIVDDGSNDDTYEKAFAASLKDNRIRVIQTEHRGCPATRNACLAMMNGDIIARQDADDNQDSRRLEAQVSYLLENEDIDLVTCRMMWLKNGLLTLQASKGMCVDSYMHGRGSRPVNASIVAWSYVYKTIGGFDEELLAGSDGDWNFRVILGDYTWGFITKPYYFYRRHTGQITKRLGKAQSEAHEAARKKYFKLWNAKSDLANTQ